MKLTKKISINELDTILIAYSALVFKDFETIRKVFDKKGNFLGMGYDNFISFLSVDFEKPDKEALFNSVEMLHDNRFIDMASHPGMICFKFNSSKPRILFITGSNLGVINEVKFSIRSIAQRKLENQLRMFKQDSEHLNLIYNN
jgi:hypothetical protein